VIERPSAFICGSFPPCVISTAPGAFVSVSRFVVSFPLENSLDSVERPTSVSVLARNAIANLVQPATGWLIVLLLPPLLVRVLSRPSYATWMLLLQFGAYIGLIDNSVQGVTMHFVARARGLRDDQYMGRMLSSAALILVFTGTAAVALCVLCSWQLPRLFGSIPESILPQARGALLVLGCSLAVALPFSVVAGTFRGLQRSEVPAIAAATGRLLGALGVAWAAYHRQGMIPMASWMAAGNLLIPAFCVIVWWRIGKKGILHLSNIAISAAREFVKFWSAMLASQFCGILITGLDIPIVAAFDFRSAGYYAVAATLSNMLTVPQSAIMQAIMPVTSSLSAENSPERLGSALIKITRYGTATLVLLTLPLLFGMAWFLRVWVGDAYAVHALPFSIVLVIAQFTRLTMQPYAVVGFSAGQQHRMLFSPFAEAIVNLTISLVLVRWIGAFGVAIGTLIGAYVGVILHFAVSMRKTDAVRMSRKRLFVQGIFRPVCCALPAATLMLIVQRIRMAALLYILTLVSGEVLTLWALFRWNFESSEQAKFIGRGKRWLRTISRKPVEAR
jgi:O-antigen/teichoic acid export membrane protein